MPPVEGLTPRRSPRLLTKRRQGAEAAISTPVREAVRKAMRLQSSEMLDYFMNMVSKYSHLRSNYVKASANKLTNYAIASTSTIIDDEHVGPHDGIRLIMSEDGKYKFMIMSTCLRMALRKYHSPTLNCKQYLRR